MSKDTFPRRIRQLGRPRLDLSLSQIVEVELRKVSIPKRHPLDYFYLTDLVNPTQAYWRRVRPETPRSRQLLERLAYGRRMHYISRFWFGELRDFRLQEANLNGYYMGVPGIVGRIDFLLGRGILEFKTKPGEGLRASDVKSTYPQDLEQLLFYAAISPDEPALNHMVYYSANPEGRITVDAFDVTFSNHRSVRAEMVRRAQDLARRQEENDAEGLPKCRYFGELCEFRDTVCQCEAAADLDTSSLFSGVDIVRNEELQNAVSARASGPGIPDDVYGIWDLIFQRQWYHRLFNYAIDEEMGPGGGDPDKKAGIALLDCAVRRTRFRVSWEESGPVRQGANQSITGPHRYMRINIPGKTGETFVPYTCKYNPWRSTPHPSGRLPDIYVAELAIHCARVNIGYGVVVVGYPNAEQPVGCYVVRFERDRLVQAVRRTMTDMQRARAQGDPSPLPFCPQFAWDTCAYMGCSCRGSIS